MSILLTSVVAIAAIILMSEILYAKSEWITTHVLGPHELRRLATSQERRQVGSEAFLAYLRRPRTWLLMLCYASGAACITYALKGAFVAVLLGLLGSEAPTHLLGTTLVLMIQLLPGVLLLWHCRSWMRRYLRNYLNAHDMPTCQECGYDLHGQTCARCPECGTPFLVDVLPRDSGAEGSHAPDDKEW